jgi:hypothetical protein
MSFYQNMGRNKVFAFCISIKYPETSKNIDDFFQRKLWKLSGDPVVV